MMALALSEPLLQNRIKACRQVRGLTQEQLGAAVGLTRVWAAMMEGGRGRPSLDTFFELARVLGVEPAELYHGTGR
jgi:transcriptional regulator with XRE-family HTH domain